MEIYKDAGYTVEERVEDLLSRMTLEEKTAQLCGDLASDILMAGDDLEELLKKKYPNGHGRFTQYSEILHGTDTAGDSGSVAVGKSMRVSGNGRHPFSGTD